MLHDLFRTYPRRIGLGGLFTAAVACCAASPAVATTYSIVDSSGCRAPSLTQALRPFGDSNWYTPLPGESNDAMTATGWTLSGGAAIKTTRLADGATGTVLDLPSGSQAIGPTICVDSTYPTARTEVRDVRGSEGVQFSVSYAGTRTWDKSKTTGVIHGQQTNWTLSDPVNVKPGNAAGWQLVRFTFVPGGKTSDFQIYNFLVDPRCRG
jgi:hypothetical protein